MTTNAMGCEQFGTQLMAYLEHEVDDATRTAIERHSVGCAECGALLADVRKLQVDSANLPVLKPSRDLWSGIAARIEAPVLDIAAARDIDSVAADDWSHSGVASRHGRSVTLGRWMRGALIAASLVLAAGIGYVAAGSREAEIAPPIAVATEPNPAVVAVAPDSAPSGPVESRARNSGMPTPPAAPPAMTNAGEVQTVLASLTADYDREIAKLRTLIEERRNQLDPVTVGIIEKNLKVIDSAIEDSKKAIARDPASRFLIESLNQSLQTKVELMRTAALLPSRT
ncbi:MAG: zf-HC2 domain-containing protein [Gemmatimonadaceae bacterium]